MSNPGRGKYDIGPAEDYFPITPDDGTDLSTNTRETIIAVGGTIRLGKANGSTVDLTLPAGRFALIAKRAYATGTSATGITGVV